MTAFSSRKRKATVIPARLTPSISAIRRWKRDGGERILVRGTPLLDTATRDWLLEYTRAAADLADRQAAELEKLCNAVELAAEVKRTFSRSRRQV